LIHLQSLRATSHSPSPSAALRPFLFALFAPSGHQIFILYLSALIFEQVGGSGNIKTVLFEEIPNLSEAVKLDVNHQSASPHGIVFVCRELRDFVDPIRQKGM